MRVREENKLRSHNRSPTRIPTPSSPPSPHQGDQDVVGDVHDEVQRHVQRPVRPAIIRVVAVHHRVVAQVAQPTIPQVSRKFHRRNCRVAREGRRHRQWYGNEELEDRHPAVVAVARIEVEERAVEERDERLGSRCTPADTLTGEEMFPNR